MKITKGTLKIPNAWNLTQKVWGGQSFYSSPKWLQYSASWELVV